MGNNINGNTEEKIRQLIQQMTLEEKASLCSGGDFWHTEAIERLDVPNMMLSDGPHGLRKQSDEADNLGINDSIKAVCYPAGCASAASFNRELIKEMGDALGLACQAEGVGVLLGPAVNIKRSPLCGRNFEYYSEDPYVAGEIASSFIGGVQSHNVGTSIKHYMGNSQETRRMTSDSIMDERTMREIYLEAFEKAVKKVKPWTVMCSYNKLNGIYTAEHEELLTQILRKEWGFDGIVVSDWGAVNDRVLGLQAGLDLEMPPSSGVNDALIVKAVQQGKLEEDILDESIYRILRLVYKFAESREENAIFNREEQHKISKKIADESIVLLKNDNILPLNKEEEVLFVGQYARSPRYQGGGSSHINSYRVTGALEMAKDNKNICYAEGFDDSTDEINEELLKEAVQKAMQVDKVVVFAGLPDSYESEGYDRTHMHMPENQNKLIQEIAKVQKNIVVVLHNGSPVEIPWMNEVKGLIEAYLSGEAVGEAVYDILYGNVNPSGKLAETFPLKLEDNPSYLFYIGEGDRVEYQEGIFVGYRYYDKKKMDVLFPFGFGLSYTDFQYSNLKIECEQWKSLKKIFVTVDITNIGKIAGKEVAQLYVGKEKSNVIRPVHELRGFEKVELQPGETKTVQFELDERAFSYYEKKIKDFYMEEGSYEISVGSSSRDLRQKETVELENEVLLPMKYHLNSTFGDILLNKEAADIMKPLYQACTMLECCDISDGNEAAAEMQKAMMEYIPIRAMVTFQDGTIDFDKLNAIVDQLNQL